MPYVRTEADETRERQCPDLIITRCDYKQVRISQFKGGRIEIRKWYSRGDGKWNTYGPALTLRNWEAQELAKRLPEVTAERLSHWTP